jgi:hypothetical protein
VRESPYFDQAKAEYVNEAKPMDLTNLNRWCSEHLALMKWLFENEASPELMEDLKSTLSK